MKKLLLVWFLIIALVVTACSEANESTSSDQEATTQEENGTDSDAVDQAEADKKAAEEAAAQAQAELEAAKTAADQAKVDAEKAAAEKAEAEQLLAAAKSEEEKVAAQKILADKQAAEQATAAALAKAEAEKAAATKASTEKAAAAKASAEKATATKATTEKTATTVKLNPNINTDSLLPIVKQPITLKVHVVRTTTQPGYMENQWFWKWAEARTNMKFEVTTTDFNVWSQKINLMFASGDLPDIFLNNNFSNTEITRFGQLEQQFLPLNTLIDQYAPDIVNAFKKFPAGKNAVTSPDGKIYTLPSYRFEPNYVSRTWIQQKWLDNLGLKNPTTTDELYAVLKAFKEKDPNGNGKNDEIPLTGSWYQGQSERSYFMTAFGLNATSTYPSIFTRDGKVRMAEAEPAYEQYLKYMNKLYTDGLIDKNIFTQSQVQQNAITAQELAGIYADGAPFLTTKDWVTHVSVNALTSPTNSQRIWPTLQLETPGKFAISKNSKHPEAAMRFANLFFTEQFNTYLWNGPQDGTPDALGYRGWIVNDKGEFAYPVYSGGATNNWEMQNQLTPINGFSLGFVPVVGVDLKRLSGKEVKQAESEAHWRGTYSKNLLPYQVLTFPSLYLSPTQERLIAEMRTVISDYTRSMEAKFITGAEPLSKVNEYFKNLEKLGSKTFVELHQAAYDQYLKNQK